MPGCVPSSGWPSCCAGPGCAPGRSASGVAVRGWGMPGCVRSGWAGCGWALFGPGGVLPGCAGAPSWAAGVRAGNGAVEKGSRAGRSAACRVRADGARTSSARRASRSVANSSELFWSARCRARCEPMAVPRPGARRRNGERAARSRPGRDGARGELSAGGSRDRPGAPHDSVAAGRRSDRNHPVTMIGSPRLGTAPIEPSRAMSGRRWRPFGVIRRGVRTSSAAQAAERAARRSDSTPSDGPGSLHAPSSAVHVRPS